MSTEKEYKRKRIGSLWHTTGKRKDGAEYYYYKGKEDKRSRRFFMQPASGKIDWNLSIGEPNPDTGGLDYIKIGYLINKGRDRSEGKLFKSNAPIVGFRNLNKKKMIEMIENEKMAGIITGEEYTDKIGRARKMPDYSVFYDNQDSLDKNKSKDVERKEISTAKVTEEEEKRIVLGEEEIGEDPIEINIEEGDY